MKKNSIVFFAVLATAAILASPASAEKNEEQKHQDKLLKLQKKLEREREERRRKNEELHWKAKIVNERYFAAQPDIKSKFQLSCPFGGYDEVIVTNRLSSELTYWVGGGSLKSGVFRRAVLVQVAKNPYTNSTVTIKSRGKNLVENMCPGGSITLVASLPPFGAGFYRDVVWVAEGNVNGRLGIAEYRVGSLSQFNTQWNAEQDMGVWLTTLTRVDKEF